MEFFKSVKYDKAQHASESTLSSDSLLIILQNTGSAH